jgi:hypothetical protein
MLHSRYRCGRGALVQVLYKLFDLVLAPLGFACDLRTISLSVAIACFKTYRAIRCVGHEARDTDASRLLLGKRPEVDALYLTLDLV